MNPHHMRSPKNQTINGAYPQWFDHGGIFASLTDAPWYESVIPESIDVVYHGSRSGMKFCSPMLYPFMDAYGEIDSFDRIRVASAIMAVYSQKWNHLWDLYSLEYSPLDSYNISEVREREGSKTGDVDDARSYDSSETKTHPIKAVTKSSLRTPNIEESTTTEEDISRATQKTETPNTTETTAIEEETNKDIDSTETTTHGHVITTDGDTTETVSDSKHGFNSQVGVPTTGSSSTGTNDNVETHSGNDVVVLDSSEVGTKEGTQTKTTTGTVTTIGSDTEGKEGSEVRTTTGTESLSETEQETYSGTDVLRTTGSDSNSRNSSENEEETTTITRRGNIFKAPAELMMADRDFWLADFFSIVFEDIDTLLTLSVYSDKPIHHTVF